MRKSNMIFLAAALGVSLFLAAFMSPFASSSPDGLEKVAEAKGFLEHAEGEGVTAWESSPMPDYSVPGIENESFSTGLAGFTGTLVMFIVGFVFAKLIRSKRQTN